MKRIGSGKRVIVAVSALSGLQSILRLYFSYLGFTGGIDEFLTSPVSQGTLHFINSAFLLLGIAGILATLGLIIGKKWGLWCSFLVLVSTVVFDVWGFKIQSTAVLGIIMPALSMIHLYKERFRFARVDPQ
ncbi:hypothetical protein HQ586_09480 [Candidatus Bathyarchaeota archaeon]|nr:hypothetical protein [Candidatus Bathyarchaeota archaeon]